MVKIIMHGCNGHMGQVISGLVEKDPDAEIVAGIDVADQGKNSYPVSVSYTHLTLPTTSRRQRQMCIRDRYIQIWKNVR